MIGGAHLKYLLSNLLYLLSTPQKISFYSQIFMKLKFSHRNARVTKCWSHDHIIWFNSSHVVKFCCWRHGEKLWCYNASFKVPLKKLGVTGSADIIKIAIMLIKTTFRNSIRVKRIPNCVLKCNFHIYMRIQTKFLIFDEKGWCEQNSSGVPRNLYLFGSSFR